MIGKTEISQELKKHLQKLYEKTSLKCETEINTFLHRVEAPKLSNTETEFSRKEITESDLWSTIENLKTGTAKIKPVSKVKLLKV